MNPKDGRVISTIIIQALNNETVTVCGDGMQTRSFCYVDDLIGGFIRLMSADDNFTGPVNLGNPEEFSIKELTDTILELTKSKSNIDYFPLPADDPARRRPDIELAKSVLNWVPKISLRQGLEMTIPYFQKN